MIYYGHYSRNFQKNSRSDNAYKRNEEVRLLGLRKSRVNGCLILGTNSSWDGSWLVTDDEEGDGVACTNEGKQLFQWIRQDFQHRFITVDNTNATLHAWYKIRIQTMGWQRPRQFPFNYYLFLNLKKLCIEEVVAENHIYFAVLTKPTLEIYSKK